MLTAPRTAIRSATTTNVYVRRSASRPIHMFYLQRTVPPGLPTAGQIGSIDRGGRQTGCQKAVLSPSLCVTVQTGSTYSDRIVGIGPGKGWVAGCMIW